MSEQEKIRTVEEVLNWRTKHRSGNAMPFDDFSLQKEKCLHFQGHGSITSGVFIVPHNFEIYIPAAVGHPLSFELPKHETGKITNYYYSTILPTLETMILMEFLNKGKLDIEPYKEGNMCLDIELKNDGVLFGASLSLLIFEGKQYKEISFQEKGMKLSELIDKIYYKKNSYDDTVKLYIWSCTSMNTIPSWIKNSCYDILPQKPSLIRKFITTVFTYNKKEMRKGSECITDKETLEKINKIDEKFKEFQYPLIRDILLEEFDRPTLTEEQQGKAKEIEQLSNDEYYTLNALNKLTNKYIRNPKEEEPFWNKLESIYNKLGRILEDENFKYLLWYHDFYQYVEEKKYTNMTPIVLHTEEPIAHGSKNYKKVYPLLVATYLPCFLVLLYEYCFDFDEIFKKMDNDNDVVYSMIKVLYQHMKLDK